MQRQPLGSTGLSVSQLGFGAFKIGRNEKIKYAQPYELPSDSDVEALLAGLIRLGVNYFDTAPAYGLSEERLGRWLPADRAGLVISTKVGETFAQGESHYDFSPAAMRASIAQSCARLNAPQLDLVFLHTPADDVGVLTETEAVRTLQELKHLGRIRAIGFSGKTVAGARLALAWADVLMVEYHLGDTSHAKIIQDAAEQGVGVVVKKGLASGTLAPSQAIPFVLDTPGVASLVLGGLNLAHFVENMQHVPREAPMGVEPT